MSAPTLYANTTLVAEAWLAELFGSSAMVGTTLPEDETKWSDTGFVQVSPMGGSRDPEVGMASPVAAIDCWANRPNSNKAPWGFANNLAERIWHGALLARPHKLVLPGSFPNVRFYTARVITEPRRIPDPASYARYNLNIQFNWSPLAI